MWLYPELNENSMPYSNLIKDNKMNKIITLAAALGCSLSAFANPSFLPVNERIIKNQPTKATKVMDIDYSGRWVGRCEGDSVNSEFVIQQTPSSLTMIFGNDKMKFIMNGVASNDRSNPDSVYQEKYIADWDEQSQSLKLKILHWGQGYGNFQLILSRLNLYINNDELLIQNTHHALFNGAENFQSGKLNCLYFRG